MVKLVLCDENKRFLLQKIGAIYECYTVPNFPGLEQIMSHIQQIANRHSFQIERVCKEFVSLGNVFLVVMCRFGSDDDLFDVLDLQGCWKHQVRDVDELLYVFRDFGGITVREKKCCCVLV